MIDRVSLFTKKRDFFLFLLTSTFILIFSLLIEYRNYKEFIRFDSALVEATVLMQYTKTKESKTYQVLKLKSDDGLTFHTTSKKSLQDVKGKKLQLEIFIDKIGFYEYLTQFYVNSKLLQIKENSAPKQKVNDFIANAHENKNIANVYQALYTNESVDKDTQNSFSNLGVSHIVAISGFHLSILSALLYFLLRPIYRFFQNRFFPYRNSKIDLFIIVVSVLFAYMLFLDSPPSLVRSFGMFVVGFVLYDRGVEVFSMQTLLVTILLLLAFFPRLSFSLGFWLSAGGVFYIFLFLIHFKSWSAFWQLMGISVLVYIFMLAVSLFIFQNFSIYHPLSIILSLLFTPFYPISILLHFIGFGDFFDSFLEWLLVLGRDGAKVELNLYLFLLHVLISFAAIWSRIAMWVLIAFSSFILVYAIYQVA
ncbi:MAG: ComEC/Rec2 family competence protein [Sulfurimonas sp.]|uniref:ComEC/Rec2 family competence protein n=1 Tax=Sulfurimonas sp. TaxID=2022749 RepID=UPI002620926B|nr:ComEC/Rec2 family competence protein [Sulfurimonas sp.]MDD5400723.1 ComEC/Rec2 family competence protein [Sulfurimonas sp.]